MRVMPVMGVRTMRPVRPVRRVMRVIRPLGYDRRQAARRSQQRAQADGKQHKGLQEGAARKHRLRR